MKTLTPFILWLCLLILSSCTKDIVPVPNPIPEKTWEKFVGHYKVYDTLGNYLYDSEMEYFTKINSSGYTTPNIRIRNLCNKMDYDFLFMEGINENFLNLGIRDSIRDYQNNHWFLNRLTDDSNSIITENHLIEGKIVLFFRITNIKYYIKESVPYVDQNVKQVYVKQP